MASKTENQAAFDAVLEALKDHIPGGAWENGDDIVFFLGDHSWKVSVSEAE